MLLLRGGRVVDPGTGRDEIADVLVRDGAIAAVGADLPADGARVLDVTGLIVGPGFVDLHSHAQSLAAHRLQALEGVTTALELEAGMMPVALAYARTADEGRPLNFGFSAAWGAARAKVLLGLEPDARVTTAFSVLGTPGWQRSSSPAELAAWLGLLAGELEAGALGIGVLVGYAPRSDPAEYLAVARLAAEAGVPTYTHIRELVEDDPLTPVDGADELVRAAAQTGAHMHHCHVNSTARRNLPRVLATIARARAEGLPVTAEAYPYGAGNTGIGAAFLAPERLAAWGLRPSSLVLVATGERISGEARLRELREADPDASCIVEFLDERDPGDRALLRGALAEPDVVVASDGMPVTWPDGADEAAWPLPPGAVTHPRTAGTFARALREMVLEDGAWTWLEAFRRCSFLPARILDAAADDARRKGHLGVGADADVVVLDPDALADRATYREPALPATGVRHLLVHGTLVVRDGELRPDERPGRPLRGRSR